jgi:6-pyruvoyltetrahydropterin/6-carboxytetrahydropterin synthase
VPYAISVRHNFETAHRLPHLPGKCESLHGHSWWTEITISAPKLTAKSIIVEYGPLKKALREWIDTYLDHGVMLGSADPLVGVLSEHGCKVHVMNSWPTVENVAAMLAGVAGEILHGALGIGDARIESVKVQETHVNSAEWRYT